MSARNETAETPHWGDPERDAADRLIALALAEDLGTPPRDVTTHATVAPAERGEVSVRLRDPGSTAGWPLVTMPLTAVTRLLDTPPARCEASLPEGAATESKATWGRLSGPLSTLLVAERTILNFLQRLCGVATLTRRYVDAVDGTHAVILDTRKTTPGWRVLEKYAVRCGGGTNHRMGLFDGVLIKDNHIAHLAGAGVATADLGTWLTDVVRPRCKDANGDSFPLEIEVDTLDQFRAVLPARPDIVLLDNMPPDVLREAVTLRDTSGLPVLLEASGGVNLETVRPIAEAGVDRISVGALTHSAPALDLGFDWADS